MGAPAPAATVLLCTRDERPDLLTRAVESILAQTFTDFELLLIDDGSTAAETLACMADLAARDGRVRVLHEPHRGLTRSLNVGLRMARGELIFRHDSDDWSHSTRMARQAAFMAAHPDVALVGSATQLHDERGRQVGRYVYPTDHATILATFPRSNPFAHGAVCFRRDVILGLGGYCEALPMAQDYDLFWRLSEAHPVANLAETLYFRRLAAGSITARSYRLRAVINRTIRMMAGERAAGRTPDPAEVRARAEQVADREARLLVGLADDQMRAGSPRAALRTYWRALVLEPTSLVTLAKIGRLALYVLLPPLRPRLFWEKGRSFLPPLKSGEL